MYDKMFLADPALWYELAENPRPLDGLFPERRAQLQQAVKEGTSRHLVILEGTLANAFYFGVLAKQAKPQQELESMDDLLRVGRCQQALKDNEVLGDLWDLWAKPPTCGPRPPKAMARPWIGCWQPCKTSGLKPVTSPATCWPINASPPRNGNMRCWPWQSSRIPRTMNVIQEGAGRFVTAGHSVFPGSRDQIAAS